MSKPESFIYTSDFATLKGDDKGTISVSMPAQILESLAQVSTFLDITIGSQNANSRIRIANNKDGNNFYACYVYNADRIGNGAGGPLSYSVLAYTARISPTTLRVYVTAKNPNPEGIGMDPGTETFTFEISTYKSPFI